MKQIIILLAISLPRIIAGDATTQAQRQRVLDTDGNELSSDSVYFILTGNDTAGSLLSSYGREGGNYCPLFVVRGPRTGDFSDLVRFTPRARSSAVAPVAATIDLSRDVSIAFPQLYTTTCAQGSTWYVTRRSPTAPGPRHQQQHVAVGNLGMSGEPPSAGVFRIEEHGGGGGGGGAETKKGYKLVSGAGKGLGLDTSSSKDRSWLAVSYTPLVVMFKKGHAARP